jgi:hypothetical protein
MTSDDCGLLRITTESHDDSEVTTLRYDTTQRASQSMTPDDYGLLLRSLDHSYKSPRRFRAFLHFDLLFDYLDSCIYNDLHNPITTPIVITLFDSYHNGSTRYSLHILPESILSNQEDDPSLSQTRTSRTTSLNSETPLSLYSETSRLHTPASNPFRPSKSKNVYHRIQAY